MAVPEFLMQLYYLYAVQFSNKTTNLKKKLNILAVASYSVS